MIDEVNLLNIVASWIKDKFPEITIDPDEHFPEMMVRLRIEPSYEGNPYTGLIGAIQLNEVMLWDNGETKLAGGRYIYYDPRDPKFFQQIYEHLVRIIELSKKGDKYGH